MKCILHRILLSRRMRGKVHVAGVGEVINVLKIWSKT